MYRQKHTLKDYCVIFGAVIISLCIGAIIALPIILKLEIGFALLDYLKR